MPNETSEPPVLRQGDCPFCERVVLTHEDPPVCPLCACPIDERRLRPFTFPADPPDLT
jgi:hypothetical protein